MITDAARKLIEAEIDKLDRAIVQMEFALDATKTEWASHEERIAKLNSEKEELRSALE